MPTRYVLRLQVDPADAAGEVERRLLRLAEVSRADELCVFAFGMELGDGHPTLDEVEDWLSASRPWLAERGYARQLGLAAIRYLNRTDAPRTREICLDFTDRVGSAMSIDHDSHDQHLLIHTGHPDRQRTARPVGRQARTWAAAARKRPRRTGGDHPLARQHADLAQHPARRPAPRDRLLARRHRFGFRQRMAGSASAHRRPGLAAGGVERESGRGRGNHGRVADRNAPAAHRNAGHGKGRAAARAWRDGRLNLSRPLGQWEFVVLAARTPGGPS